MKASVNRNQEVMSENTNEEQSDHGHGKSIGKKLLEHVVLKQVSLVLFYKSDEIIVAFLWKAIIHGTKIQMAFLITIMMYMMDFTQIKLSVKLYDFM